MHSARSTGQASLHITLGLTAFTWAEFLVESVTAAALRFATTTDEFAVQDLPDCLDGGGKLTLVTRLVREGVFQSAAQRA